MNDFAKAIAKARTRLEALVDDMDEIEAAELLASVETAVLRHPNRRLGEATPFTHGTPQHQAFHAAVGPGVELPADRQGLYARQAATLLQVVARERRELGAMVDEAVDLVADGMARGRRQTGRFTVRILRRIRETLLRRLETETDASRIAAAVASYIGTVRDAELGPGRDASAFVDETFAALNPAIDRCRAGTVFDALDGATRDWLRRRMMADA